MARADRGRRGWWLRWLRPIPALLVWSAVAAAPEVTGGAAAGGHVRGDPGVDAQRAGVRLRIRTEAGDIDVFIDTVRAPVTAANFLRYVDGGSYGAGAFHRTVRPDNQPDDTVKIEVIQASRRRGTTGYAAIPLERTSETGLKHVDGALSMARAGPDTATSDFFICIGAQPSLDFGGARNPDGQGFAVFGRVVRGMDVVRRIQASPAESQRLTPRIGIVSIERISGVTPRRPYPRVRG